jgi:hypothetical protein
MVAAEAGAPAELDGHRIVLHADDAQATLLRLTTWADRAGVALDEIEVSRPTLEDVFLELTGPVAVEQSHA